MLGSLARIMLGSAAEPQQDLLGVWWSWLVCQHAGKVMVRLCLPPAVMARGSACPCTGGMCLGRGSGEQEQAWKGGELTLLDALA